MSDTIEQARTYDQIIEARIAGKIAAGEADRQEREAQVNELINHPTYVAVKAALETLAARPGSTFTVEPDDIVKSPTKYCWPPCWLETSLGRIEFFNAILPDKLNCGILATINLPFYVRGSTAIEVDPEKAETDASEILEAMTDAAIANGQLTLSSETPQTPTVPNPHWANSRRAKIATLLLAVGVGIGSAVEMVLGERDLRTGNKQASAAVADIFTPGEPQHTRLQDAALYEAGEKLSHEGNAESGFALLEFLGVVALEGFRRKLGEPS